MDETSAINQTYSISSFFKRASMLELKSIQNGAFCIMSEIVNYDSEAIQMKKNMLNWMKEITK